MPGHFINPLFLMKRAVRIALRECLPGFEPCRILLVSESPRRSESPVGDDEPRLPGASAVSFFCPQRCVRTTNLMFGVAWNCPYNSGCDVSCGLSRADRRTMADIVRCPSCQRQLQVPENF